MWITKLDNQNKKILVAIPLTNGTGKTRIKKRSFFNEYGIPVSTKTETFSQNCYVEWQIGYDAVIADTKKLDLTTIKDKLFIGANGKEKTLYELSEYIYYQYKWYNISTKQLLEIKTFLENLKDSDFIDNPDNFSIQRTAPIEKTIQNIQFYYTQVKYPMLVHKFGKYEILTEIKITEKQYAIGVQPMLYLCIPINELSAQTPLIGRTASTKETANFEIDYKNINIFLEMLKIFGMLSKSHNKDIISIIDTILE